MLDFGLNIEDPSGFDDEDFEEDDVQEDDDFNEDDDFEEVEDWETDFGFSILNPHKQVDDYEGTTFDE